MKLGGCKRMIKVENDTSQIKPTSFYFKPFGPGSRSSSFIVDIGKKAVATNIKSHGECSPLLRKIWLEILAETEGGLSEHAGFIRGYHVDMEDLLIMLEANDEDTAYEFFCQSGLTQELYEYLIGTELGKMRPDYYFLNSIVLEEKYDNPNIHVMCANEIPGALAEIHSISIGTIIYSYWGPDCSKNLTVGDETKYRWDNEMHELKKRKYQNVLMSDGFEIFNCPGYSDNIYLYKSYEPKGSQDFTEDK